MPDNQDSLEAGTPETPAFSPRRRKLRFDNRFKSVPNGYISLGKAIDRLARERFPDHWDELLSVRKFPLQYEQRRKRFCFYGSSPRAPFRLHCNITTPQTAAEREQFREASRVYKKVRFELKHAIEANEITAVLLDPVHGYRVFEPVYASIQMRRVFYTGNYLLKVNDELHRCTVLMKLSTFEDWLSGKRQRDHSHAAGVRRHMAEFILIGEKLMVVIVERKISITSVFLKALLNYLKHRSELHFDYRPSDFEYIWERYVPEENRHPRKRPTKADQARLNELRSSLEVELAEEILIKSDKKRAAENAANTTEAPQLIASVDDRK